MDRGEAAAFWLRSSLTCSAPASRLVFAFARPQYVSARKTFSWFIRRRCVPEITSFFYWKHLLIHPNLKTKVSLTRLVL